MASIHRIVLRRLLLAWALVSLGIGFGVYYIEIEKIDDYVVALATAEASQFTLEGLDHGHHTPRQLADLQQRALEFAHRNFVVIELYGPDKKKLVEAVNPRHQAIEIALKPYAHTFPLGTRSHYEKYDILGQTVVQVLVPLTGTSGEIAGYFEGVFVVDRETLSTLQDNLLRTLAASLLAVLLTTVVLYPVILALNRDVIRFSREVLKGNLEMGSVLGAAIAKRDSDTGEHNYRVTLYAIRLGEAVSLDAHAMRGLILGAFLHDVGKIGISDNILLKPGPLTEAEFAVMRTHVALGVDIVAASEWLEAAREVIEYHHEKFDGSGYLQGLRGEAIPLAARIFAIVDVFDALTSRRPYKEPFSLDRALAIMTNDAGTHFDPTLVARFAAIAEKLHQAIGEASEPELGAMLRAEAMHYFFAASVSHRG